MGCKVSRGMTKTHRTLCNRDCPDACQIIATVENGRVTRLQGDPDHPVTRGFLCYRTSNFLPLQYGKSRLTRPLLRKDGELQPVSWDEALDTAAERLLEIRQSSGPEAIFHYRSGGTMGMLAPLSDYFFEQFGPVTIKRGDICSGAGEAAQELDFGCCESHDLFDLNNARNILLWGKNVFVSSVHSIPVLKQSGAGLVLIDPVHHKTASICERYIQPRPAGDFALALAVASLLFEHGWTDPEAARYCDHLDEFRALAQSRSTADWCAQAGVSSEEALDLARRLGPDGPTAILVGWGMARRSGGGAIVRALDALGAISGNLGRPGGGVSYYFQRGGAFDRSFIRGRAVAPRTVCEPLFGPELLRIDDPPIRAVWITAGNPVAMLPETETVVRALRSREFVVVVDSFITDTTRQADLVLPTTTLLEADDLLGAYGHHWIGVATPVVPPPPEVKSDLQILQGLASRVGLSAQMAGDARDWKQRMIAPKLGPHGISLETLEAAPMRNPLPAKVLFADRVFPTASGRVNLIHQAPEASPQPSADYPLMLLSLSTDRAQASQWSATLDGPAIATVHPDATPELADGDLAQMQSPVGSMTVRIKHDTRQRTDIALVPKGGHRQDGRCANSLIQARITDIGEGGALYDEFVRIVPL